VLAVREDPQIKTERLMLIPCPLSVADALVGSHAEAARLLGVQLPPDWPDPELAEFLPLYANDLRDHPDALGYGVWLLVEQNSRTVVGSSGFRGRPNAEGELEIGYGIHPDYRNRGFATEAVRALLAWGLAQSGVRRIAAHCDPTNTASLRVAAGAGMRKAGERNGLSRWLMT
jgi:ribosomal-protein-alanine N-acetyltransferase